MLRRHVFVFEPHGSKTSLKLPENHRPKHIFDLVLFELGESSGFITCCNPKKSCSPVSFCSLITRRELPASLCEE